MTKQILLNVDYRHNDEKFWAESHLKDKVVTIDPDKSIHQEIKRILSEIDYCELSYKGKPQGNIFIDTKDGESKIIGYHYRGKMDIQTDHKWISANFTVWVSISEIKEYEIEEIEPK